MAELGARIGRVLSTTDHKVIGRLYLGTSFGFFLAGGVMALLMRSELAYPGMQFVDEAVGLYRAQVIDPCAIFENRRYCTE